MNMATPALAIFTGKGTERLLQEGGTGDWVLDRSKARRFQYVVCIKNQHAAWSEGDEPHGAAFLVGKIKDVILAPGYEPDNARYLVQFHEVARVDVPGAWKAWRNPVRYTTLEELGVELDKLDFEGAAAASSPAPTVEGGRGKPGAPLTIAQAKVLLSQTYEVPPENIEIIIRG